MSTELIEHPLWLEKLSSERQRQLDKNWIVFSPKGLYHIQSLISKGKLVVDPAIELHEDSYVPTEEAFGMLNRQSFHWSVKDLIQLDTKLP
jgi:hypothetical protein